MRVLVTCGPSYEPLDQVRRITNFSTGELGVALANRLWEHEVICCRGVGSTTALPVEQAEVIPFTTNSDLLARLAAIAKGQKIDAVFHLAALSDFTVQSIRNPEGRDLQFAKLPSSENLIVTLVPAMKLISRLRGYFPDARIVGWKYELNDGRSEAIGRARRQMESEHLNACVVNGAAYGPGFGFLTPAGAPVHLADKKALVDFLADWLAKSD